MPNWHILGLGDLRIYTDVQPRPSSFDPKAPLDTQFGKTLKNTRFLNKN